MCEALLGVIVFLVCVVLFLNRSSPQEMRAMSYKLVFQRHYEMIVLSTILVGIVKHLFMGLGIMFGIELLMFEVFIAVVYVLEVVAARASAMHKVCASTCTAVLYVVLVVMLWMITDERNDHKIIYALSVEVSIVVIVGLRALQIWSATHQPGALIGLEVLAIACYLTQLWMVLNPTEWFFGTAPVFSTFGALFQETWLVLSIEAVQRKETTDASEPLLGGNVELSSMSGNTGAPLPNRRAVGSGGQRETKFLLLKKRGVAPSGMYAAGRRQKARRCDRFDVCYFY